MQNRIQAVGMGLALLFVFAICGEALAESHRYKTTGPTQVELNGGDVGEQLHHLPLQLGKSAILRTDYAVKRVSIANPEIADVVVLGSREINVVPSEIGETNIILWDAQGRAQSVVELVVGRAHAAVESTLQHVMSSDNIQVESVGQSIVLKGSVDGAADVERALRVAAALFPEKEDEGNIINLIDVGSSQQVMIEVSMAEMSRNLTREMETNFQVLNVDGSRTFRFFNFIDGLTGTEANPVLGEIITTFTDRTNLVTGLVNGDDSYQLFMNLLKGRGLIRILAEPTLVARSGQSANFLVGGEVPIPISQGGASLGSITVRFKEFGVGVEFTPTVLDANRIHMEVTPEVSEPDFTLGTAVNGTTVPGFRTRRASTGVELGDGQAFAIAGLLSDTVRESSSQYPLLGDIPVLGTLFRSKQYSRNETELVMIVRPRLVKPLDGERPPLPTDNFVEPSDWEFYLTNAMEGRAKKAGKSADLEPAGGMFGGLGHRVSITEAEKELR